MLCKPAFLSLFPPTHLIPIKHEHSCKILYIFDQECDPVVLIYRHWAVLVHSEKLLDIIALGKWEVLSHKATAFAL